MHVEIQVTNIIIMTQLRICCRATTKTFRSRIPTHTQLSSSPVVWWYNYPTTTSNGCCLLQQRLLHLHRNQPYHHHGVFSYQQQRIITIKTSKKTTTTSSTQQQEPQQQLQQKQTVSSSSSFYFSPHHENPSPLSYNKKNNNHISFLSQHHNSMLCGLLNQTEQQQQQRMMFVVGSSGSVVHSNQNHQKRMFASSVPDPIMMEKTKKNEHNHNNNPQTATTTTGTQVTSSTTRQPSQPATTTRTGRVEMLLASLLSKSNNNKTTPSTSTTTTKTTNSNTVASTTTTTTTHQRNSMGTNNNSSNSDSSSNSNSNNIRTNYQQITNTDESRREAVNDILSKLRSTSTNRTNVGVVVTSNNNNNIPSPPSPPNSSSSSSTSNSNPTIVASTTRPNQQQLQQQHTTTNQQPNQQPLQTTTKLAPATPPTISPTPSFVQVPTSSVSDSTSTNTTATATRANTQAQTQQHHRQQQQQEGKMDRTTTTNSVTSTTGSTNQVDDLPPTFLTKTLEHVQRQTIQPKHQQQPNTYKNANPFVVDPVKEKQQQQQQQKSVTDFLSSTTAKVPSPPRQTITTTTTTTTTIPAITAQDKTKQKLEEIMSQYFTTSPKKSQQPQEQQQTQQPLKDSTRRQEETKSRTSTSWNQGLDQKTGWGGSRSSSSSERYNIEESPLTDLVRTAEKQRRKNMVHNNNKNNNNQQQQQPTISPPPTLFSSPSGTTGLSNLEIIKNFFPSIANKTSSSSRHSFNHKHSALAATATSTTPSLSEQQRQPSSSDHDSNRTNSMRLTSPPRYRMNQDSGTNALRLDRAKRNEERANARLSNAYVNMDQDPQGVIDQWFQKEKGEEYHSRPLRRKKKIRIVETNIASIIIPSYHLSVHEFSSLLGIKKTKIRKLMRNLGIESSTQASSSSDAVGLDGKLTAVGDDDDNFCMLDTDSMELIAMELNISFNKSDKKNEIKLSDDDILLKRRNMANDTTLTTTTTATTTTSGSSVAAPTLTPADTTAEPTTKVVETIPLYQTYPTRAPVVCIMGHVDHGKTTLMDALRKRAANQQSVENKGTTKNGTKDKSKNNKNKKTNKNKKKDSNNSGAKSLVKSVAGTEAGGITQVISAFQVKLQPDNDDDAEDDNNGVIVENKNNRFVTFLDTPGHAAFKDMRQSGSDAADVIVLVIAADDGVSEQTIEIINFYKSIVKESKNANNSISLVIAMNKIDKPGLDLEECQRKIENQLLEQDIYTESIAAISSSSTEFEYGAPAQLIPVSGLTGQGLDDLIEGLLLQSDIMDLRADPTAPGEGVIMDARVAKGYGIVVDCILRWGTIKKGDVVVSGTTYGKVRLLQNIGASNQNMGNDNNNDDSDDSGYPSEPVRIIGFESVPKAGDPIIVVENEEIARDIITRRKIVLGGSSGTGTTTMDSGSSSLLSSALGSGIGALIQKSDTNLQSAGKHLITGNWVAKLGRPAPGGTAENLDFSDDLERNQPVIRIPVIIKADADGTLSAVRDAIIQIGSKSIHNVYVDPIKCGIGPALNADVMLAKECEAILICFNVKNDTSVQAIATAENITMLRSDVIYKLLDAAKVHFAPFLPTRYNLIVHGRAKVLATYDVSASSSSGGKKKGNTTAPVISKGGLVAGLKIVDGTLFREKSNNSTVTTKFRIIRNGKILTKVDVFPEKYEDEEEVVVYKKEDRDLDESDSDTEKESSDGMDREVEKLKPKKIAKKNDKALEPCDFKATSLKHYKDDVDELSGTGTECGLILQDFPGPYQVNDIIECYSIETIQEFV